MRITTRQEWSPFMMDAGKIQGIAGVLIWTEAGRESLAAREGVTA